MGCVSLLGGPTGQLPVLAGWVSQFLGVRWRARCVSGMGKALSTSLVSSTGLTNVSSVLFLLEEMLGLGIEKGSFEEQVREQQRGDS